MSKNSQTSYKLKALENIFLVSETEASGEIKQVLAGEVFTVATAERQTELLGKVSAWNGKPLCEICE